MADFGSFTWYIAVIETAIFQDEESTMRHENSVFNHVVKALPRWRFERLIAAHDGD